MYKHIFPEALEDPPSRCTRTPLYTLFNSAVLLSLIAAGARCVYGLLNLGATARGDQLEKSKIWLDTVAAICILGACSHITQMSSSKRHAGKKSVTANGGSRGRCGIYEEIDSLADCLTLPENKQLPNFVARSQKIFNLLAYYALNSDGAILEEQEKWHTTFADRLYQAAGQARTEAIANRTAADDRPLPAVPPQRKAADDLPDSLRQIMNGSHKSLDSDDDEDP
jgi:hypothetical protein